MQNKATIYLNLRHASDSSILFWILLATCKYDRGVFGKYLFGGRIDPQAKLIKEDPSRDANCLIWLACLQVGSLYLSQDQPKCILDANKRTTLTFHFETDFQILFEWNCDNANESEVAVCSLTVVLQLPIVQDHSKIQTNLRSLHKTWTYLEFLVNFTQSFARY